MPHSVSKRWCHSTTGTKTLQLYRKRKELRSMPQLAKNIKSSFANISLLCFFSANARLQSIHDQPLMFFDAFISVRYAVNRSKNSFIFQPPFCNISIAYKLIFYIIPHPKKSRGKFRFYESKYIGYINEISSIGTKLTRYPAMLIQNIDKLNNIVQHTILRRW